MNLKEDMRKFLINNDFEKLISLLMEIDVDVWGSKLLDIAFDNSTLSTYTLVCFLLMKKESAKMHLLASTLLSQSLSHVEGAYVCGYYHAKKAAALDSNNIGYKEALLFYYEIPDQILNKETAISLAQEVLKSDPNSTVAKNVLDGN